LSSTRPRKIYLGSFKSVGVIKKLNPTLIYFICYRKNPVEYRVNSRIIDVEQDCQALQKFNITIFIPPKARIAHRVTYSDCIFTAFGKSIMEELIEESLCSQMHENLDFKNRRVFNLSFVKNFSFSIDPADIVTSKLKKIQQNYEITLPQNNYTLKKRGSNITINYSVDKDLLFMCVLLLCSCGHVTTQEIKQETLIKHYHSDELHVIRCSSDSCNLEFYISPSFYYFFSVTV